MITVRSVISECVHCHRFHRFHNAENATSADNDNPMDQDIAPLKLDPVIPASRSHMIPGNKREA
jgi:hypothetical protein